MLSPIRWELSFARTQANVLRGIYIKILLYYVDWRLFLSEYRFI
ncbi:Uncharacterized protein dnm_025510 [Desulfonema magnum]|uniref:Uncharacterized protein n=1 Tax=Desulfonema magnum TaxID=45655 RepID=A0A975BJ54_9BACT|nr:Uncharacterized protein dnm_025510 [Desulfonema magnum]